MYFDKIFHFRDIVNRNPSTDTVSSRTTDDTQKLLSVDNKSSKLELYGEIPSESKDSAKAKPKPQGIKNRRKSMPLFR